METRLLLIRHPQTEANIDGRFVGKGDTPYTPLGELQKQLLAAEIEDWAPARILSSPLRRAREVAELAGARAKVKPTFDERLTELDFGIAEGFTHEDLEQRGIEFDFKNEHAPVAPGGESRRDIYDRAAHVVTEQLSLGGRIAIVTHGGVYRSVLVHVLQLPLTAIWSFDIQPGQVADIVHFGDRAILRTFRRPKGEPEE